MRFLKRAMRGTMTWTRLVFINILITIVLFILIELMLKTAFLARDVWRAEAQKVSPVGPNVTEEVSAFRSEIKAFTGYPYKAFLGWTSPDISGTYLNVKNGRRRTLQPGAVEFDQTLHFFGGSTMWGHSVSDSNTIPSLIASKLQTRAVNYGEQAYNSRQELNLLIDNLDGFERRDLVLFYDGINDVYHNCKSYNSPNGHAREFYLRDRLSGSSSVFLDLFKKTSTFSLLRGLSVRNGPEFLVAPYDDACQEPFYASQVADFIINNWRSAEAILARKGIPFVCVLQPSPYTLSEHPSYYSEEYDNQMRAVYPLIRERASELSCFRDMSYLLTADNYVDACCHLNEDGNLEMSELISREIVKIRKKAVD